MNDPAAKGTMAVSSPDRTNGTSEGSESTRRVESALVIVAPAGRVARGFRDLQWRRLRNGLESGWAGSRVRIITVLACSLVFWLFLFAFFFEGFQFLSTFGLAMQSELIEYVFSLFFLSLLVMLLFSTGIILYTGLYHSREAQFLLALPASSDRIFAHKFLEAISFSSWGSLILGSPMLLAYGIVAAAPWGFYVVFLGYLLGIVLIPGGIGAICALLIAVVLPRREKTVLVFAGMVVLLVGIVILIRLWQPPGAVMTQEWINQMLGRLSFSQNPLLASRWTSAGLLAASRDDWFGSLFYLGALLSHAALIYLVAAVLARDLYRRGYSRVQGNRSTRRHFGLQRLDRLLHRLFGVLPYPVRLLILKDLRTFRRDPAQWSQFLIFFGLLVFYFLNIRRLNYDDQPHYWRYVLSFLNLSVTALILSTFTSRFIFPLMSLEGRNFWILGLFPLKRSTILWGKFAFASGISLVATEILIVISDVMLRMSPLMTALHMAILAILCLGLSGISVGLGARLPNLKEEDPSKIATGFGGTLNLLVSLGFIVLVIGAIALPCQLYFATRDVQTSGALMFSDATFLVRMRVGILLSIGLGAAATIIPLRVGIRAFQRMEL